jgi:sugar phosphate isomerase/epimerase
LTDEYVIKAVIKRKIEEKQMKHKIGLIGMINDELEQDLWGPLKNMSDLGYQGFESSMFVSDSKDEMKESRKKMDDLGMDTVALVCSHYNEENLGKTIEAAQILGSKYVVSYWSGPETTDEALALAEQFERMAVKCNEGGLDFIYHNHEHEFISKFGEKKNECIFDIYYKNTEKLKFELDIAWCTFGGADPVQVIRRCGERISVLHVKDLSELHTRGLFCAVGMGKVNCFGTMEAAAARGTEWMVVEQDKPGNLTHYESAMASILNIREAGLR